MQNQIERTSGYAYYALALLMVVYILNFLDRTIIYILFPLIKKKWRFPTRSSRFWERPRLLFFTRFWEFLSGGWRIAIRGQN